MATPHNATASGRSGSKERSAVTLRDIAAELGLSTSAVSMALVDHPRIGADTKDRVLEAARRLGYVANSAGRALRARRADAIALIVPNTSQHVFGHAYFMHVLTGVTAAANERDAQVVISTNADELDGIAAYERVMRSGSVDGAIIAGAPVADDNIQRIVERGLAVVLLGRFPHLPDAVSVGVDDVAASRAATDHLIAGHDRRSLVHVSGPLDHQSAIDRRDGFLEATGRHGVEGHVVVGDYSETSGAAAAATIAEIDGVDGVVAANDEMAFGAMRTLRSLGRDVPRDFSIIGFDDFGLSRLTTPSISTVRVPAEQIARLATARLLDLIAGTRPDSDGAHGVLPFDLVLRQSCGCQAPDEAPSAVVRPTPDQANTAISEGEEQ